MFRHVVLMAFTLAACASDATSTGIVASCPPNSGLTYDGYGQLVIREKCLSCHAGKERPALDTVERVRANRDAIMSEAVETTAMPDGRNMTLEERTLLGEWLACGAP